MNASLTADSQIVYNHIFKFAYVSQTVMYSGTHFFQQQFITGAVSMLNLKLQIGLLCILGVKISLAKITINVKSFMHEHK